MVIAHLHHIARALHEEVIVLSKRSINQDDSLVLMRCGAGLARSWVLLHTYWLAKTRTFGQRFWRLGRGSDRGRQGRLQSC